ncbi:MAG: flagellar export chaperone FliS [Acidobacteriota bacterium]|nr:flagellar export chaperone FliS [Acidobacteriota bacterium]
MNPYYEQSILNAEPLDLTRMVYRHAIASVREAREHLEQKRIRERAASINNAYSAIAELLGSLRPESAPEISARLQGLYGYMLRRLLDANMSQTDPPLAEVLGLLVTLEEAWAEVAARAVHMAVNVAAERSPGWNETGEWNESGAGRQDCGRLALNA